MASRKNQKSTSDQVAASVVETKEVVRSKAADNKKDLAKKAADKKAADKKAAKKKAAKKPGLIERAKVYLKGVKTEIKRVTWPTKKELIKYTGAVLGMLIFFGILIALVDALIVPVLYAFQGLR